jgi:hypothetical protein
MIGIRVIDGGRHRPRRNADDGAGEQGGDDEETATDHRILIGIEPFLLEVRPDCFVSTGRLGGDDDERSIA